MDTQHCCFTHKKYGQLAFCLAAGIVPGDFLEELSRTRGYFENVLRVARKMDTDATIEEVDKYLYDVHHFSEISRLPGFRDIHILGPYAAIACADFFLRSNEETHEQVILNTLIVKEKGRVCENGHLQTVSQFELQCFTDQVFRRAALLHPAH